MGSVYHHVPLGVFRAKFLRHLRAFYIPLKVFEILYWLLVGFGKNPDLDAHNIQAMLIA